MTHAQELAIYLTPEAPHYRGRFPPLLLITVGSPIAVLVIWHRAGGRKRTWLVFATVGLTALIFAGCGGSGPSPNIPTPIDVYSLEVTGSALDANGNPLNASRALAFTLDVIAGPSRFCRGTRWCASVTRSNRILLTRSDRTYEQATVLRSTGA